MFLSKHKQSKPVSVDPPVEEEAVEEQVVESAILDIDPESIKHDIAKLLQFSTFEPEQRYWCIV